MKIDKFAPIIVTQGSKESQLGFFILTDWSFTPDLAVGSSCPAPTNLPPATS